MAANTRTARLEARRVRLGGAERKFRPLYSTVQVDLLQQYNHSCWVSGDLPPLVSMSRVVDS
jgi:hypothetical protein